MSTKQLVKAAVSVNMPKAARKKKPEKPAKSILFEFKNPLNAAGPPIQRGYPHWTEVLFLLILITSISMVFVSKDNVESKGELDNSLLASVGIWMATAVSSPGSMANPTTRPPKSQRRGMACGGGSGRPRPDTV